MIWLLMACLGGTKEKTQLAPEQSCGTAAGVFADNVETMAHFDGDGYSTIADQSFSFGSVAFADNPLHEATRFELERPARIHGFSVQYGKLPSEGEVKAGLYGDFGYNGFDFWASDPIWEGTRCVSEVQVGEWVDFVLSEPVEVEQPGLIYVAQRREGTSSEPALYFTEGGVEECSEWEDCHSAWNLPESHETIIDGTQHYAYNGFSGPFQFDYLVRLKVEWLDTESPPVFFDKHPDVSLGGRQAWGDFNNDGFEDVFAGGKLLQNDGQGAFLDVSEASGINGFGMTASGGIWGDYDNDGHLDLFVFAESGNANDRLLQNQGDGSFADVTTPSLIDDYQEENTCGGGYVTRPTAAAAWWDIDGDGFLDLYQSNFICWTDWTFFKDTVWMNNGDGTFAEMSGENGFFSREYSGRGASPADGDNDGDIDLLVNNYTLHRNLFFRNKGDGSVQESGITSKLAGTATGNYYGHTIGAAWGDLDNDGDLDMIHANLAHPRFFDFSNKTQVLLNDGTGVFQDIQGDWSTPQGAAGLRYQETHSVPTLADFDQDGILDLVISAVYPGRPTDFYWGAGDGSFVLDVLHAGLDKRNGWGVSAADFDNDGDMDVAVSENLYQNNKVDQGAWLQVRAVGNQGSNQAGIGAMIKVHTDAGIYLRHINGGSGQGDQDSIIAHFGLGDAQVVNKIELRFPMREWLVFDGPHDLDQRLWLHEDGTVVSGWHP